MTAFGQIPTDNRIGAIVAQTGDRLQTVAHAARQRVARIGERRDLPVLDETHPAGVNGTRLNLGVQEVAVDAIRGTAVGGPKLRGADFKPIPDARTAGWRIRWQRMEDAHDRLVTLPPIEVFEVGGEYWVVDGHNRVAMARERHLAYLDANVTGIRWRGGPELSTKTGSLGAVLEASTQQRAAASDRWSAGSVATLAAVRGWRPPALNCCGA